MSDSLIIIPTYNEAENITRMVRTILALRNNFHLLVVDDGSPDGTADLVKALQPEFPTQLHLLKRPGKEGLGTAYIAGFKWALERAYAYVFEMDADFSHNPKDLERLYQVCARDGADVAIGSRYIVGVNVVNWPLGRVLMSYFASYYVRWITRLPVYDATAGFKCYRRKVLEIIHFEKIQFVGYAFQIEMKFQAWKYGFKVKEIPVVFTDRVEGKSKMSRSIFAEAVFGVLQMKLKSIFTKYTR